MAGRALNPVPSWGTLSLAQLRMVALLQRRDFAILGGLAAALVALAIGAYVKLPVEEVQRELRTIREALPIFPSLVLPLVPIAALWPLGVWRSEDPARRGYFWSMPVARGPHTLLRVTAGWVLLMGVSLAVMLLALGLAAPLAVRYGEIRLSLAYACVPFVMPTLAYVILSVLAIAFDNPLRFIAWLAAAVFGVALVSEVLDAPAAMELMEDAFESLGLALAGPLAGMNDTLVAEEPWARQWALHYFTWLGGAIALLVLVAFRRQEVAG